MLFKLSVSWVAVRHVQNGPGLNHQFSVEENLLLIMWTKELFSLPRCELVENEGFWAGKSREGILFRNRAWKKNGSWIVSPPSSTYMPSLMPVWLPGKLRTLRIIKTLQGALMHLEGHVTVSGTTKDSVRRQYRHHIIMVIIYCVCHRTQNDPLVLSPCEFHCLGEMAVKCVDLQTASAWPSHRIQPPYSCKP